MPVEHSDPEEKVICSSVSSFYFFFLQLYDGTSFQSSCSKCVCLNLLKQSQVLISMLAKNLLVFSWAPIRMYLFPFSICISYVPPDTSQPLCLLIPFLQRGISSLKGKVGDEKILDFALKVQPSQLHRDIFIFKQ